MSAARSSRPASTFKVANVRTGRLDSPLAVIPFFVSYLLPVVFLRSTNLATDSRGSESALCNSWTCAWFVFTVLPVLEMVVPDDLANPTDEESRRAAKDWRYKLPLYLWALPQCAVIVFGARALSRPFRLAPPASRPGPLRGRVHRRRGHHRRARAAAQRQKAGAVPGEVSALLGVLRALRRRAPFRTSSPGGDAGRSGNRRARRFVLRVLGSVRVRDVPRRVAHMARRERPRPRRRREADVRERVHERRAPFPALWSVALFFANARRRAPCFFLAQALVARRCSSS